MPDLTYLSKQILCTKYKRLLNKKISRLGFQSVKKKKTETEAKLRSFVLIMLSEPSFNHYSHPSNKRTVHVLVLSYFNLTLYSRMLPSPQPARNIFLKKELKLKHDIPPIPRPSSRHMATLPLMTPAPIRSHVTGPIRPALDGNRGERNALGRGEFPSLEAWVMLSPVPLTMNRLGSSGEKAKARTAAAEVVMENVPAEIVGSKLARENSDRLTPRPPSSAPGCSDFDKVRRNRPPGLRPRSVWSVRSCG